MLIGLTGAAGSGKDTACGFIKEWGAGYLPVEREAFADRLKLSAARIFFPDISLEDAVIWCNEMKKHGTLVAAIPIGHRALDVHTSAITGRRFLQAYGTEAHRNVFHDDFWIDAAIPHDWARRGTILVITDCRFPNEAEAIHRRDGEVWRIVRPMHQIEESAHASELPLADDLVNTTIVNDCGLSELKRAVFTTMDSLYPGRVARCGNTK